MQIKKITGILFLVPLIIWGCGQSGEQKSSVKEQAPQTEQVAVPQQQTPASGELDQFGRSTEDAHYGHDHPPKEESNPKIDSTQTPASGELDKFGRSPSDAHYGHGHE